MEKNAEGEEEYINVDKVASREKRLDEIVE